MYKLLILALLALLAHSRKREELGRNEADLRNTYVQGALKNGVKQLNTNDQFNSVQIAVDVDKVSVEVLEGYLYSFENVTLQETNCVKKRTPLGRYDECKPEPGGGKTRCSFQVYVRLYLHPLSQYKLMNDDCMSMRD